MTGPPTASDSVVEFVATDADARWLVEVGSWTVPTGRPRRGQRGRSAGEPTAVVTAPVAGPRAVGMDPRRAPSTISGEAAARDALDALITQGMQ